MKRKMDIIAFTNTSRSSWYKVRALEIEIGKRHFDRGEIISIGRKKYMVIEDYGHLRVAETRYSINPFQPIFLQLDESILHKRRNSR